MHPLNIQAVDSFQGPLPDWYPAFLKLYEEVFKKSFDVNDLLGRAGKNKILLLAALNEAHFLGFKLGYALDNHTFYSWMGAVSPLYRKMGVGSRLMDAQHEWCRVQGYLRVQTKTKNQWREMLLLNIRSGFDIIGTYTDEHGEPKIILEKSLIPSRS